MKAIPSGDSYDERLVRVVLEGGAQADGAALTLFERHEPTTPTQAVNLIVPYGPVPPETFARIGRVYDAYRHAREMPCD